LLLSALTWRVQAATGHMAAVDRYGADWVATLRSEPLTALMRALHKLQGKVVAVAILIGMAVLVRRRR
jgi:cytochrome b